MTERLKPRLRSRMQRELDYYMAALNVDPQFAVRKCIFYIRSLALPNKMSIKEALGDLMLRLAAAREQFGLGRPWNRTQLIKCYWTRNKRFVRRPVQPMTPEEWVASAKANRDMLERLKRVRKRRTVAIAKRKKELDAAAG